MDHSSRLQYKYVKIKNSGEYQWEDGTENRNLCLMDLPLNARALGHTSVVYDSEFNRIDLCKGTFEAGLASPPSSQSASSGDTHNEASMTKSSTATRQNFELSEQARKELVESIKTEVIAQCTDKVQDILNPKVFCELKSKLMEDFKNEAPEKAFQLRIAAKGGSSKIVGYAPTFWSPYLVKVNEFKQTAEDLQAQIDNAEKAAENAWVLFNGANTAVAHDLTSLRRDMDALKAELRGQSVQQTKLGSALETFRGAVLGHESRNTGEMRNRLDMQAAELRALRNELEDLRERLAAGSSSDSEPTVAEVAPIAHSTAAEAAPSTQTGGDVASQLNEVHVSEDGCTSRRGPSPPPPSSSSTSARPAPSAECQVEVPRMPAPAKEGLPPVAPAPSPKAPEGPLEQRVEEAGEKAAVRMKVAKPVATKPQAPKPEAAKPEAARPQAAQPEAAQPEAAKPEAAKPEATKPEAAKTKAADPEAVEPGVAKPEATSPLFAIPGLGLEDVALVAACLAEGEHQAEPFFKDPPHPVGGRSREITMQLEKEILKGLKKDKEERRKLVKNMQLKVHPDKGFPADAYAWFQEWKEVYLAWYLRGK